MSLVCLLPRDSNLSLTLILHHLHRINVSCKHSFSTCSTCFLFLFPDSLQLRLLVTRTSCWINAPPVCCGNCISFRSCYRSATMRLPVPAIGWGFPLEVTSIIGQRVRVWCFFAYPARSSLALRWAQDETVNRARRLPGFAAPERMINYCKN